MSSDSRDHPENTWSRHRVMCSIQYGRKKSYHCSVGISAQRISLHGCVRKKTTVYTVQESNAFQSQSNLRKVTCYSYVEKPSKCPLAAMGFV